LEEIDNDRFWGFLERAVKGFGRWTERVAQKPEDLMPWKKLGQRWHWSRKGFPPGKRVLWELDVLEQLCEMLHETSPEGQFLWNNQQVVHFMVQGQKEPWASLFTKRLASVDLTLTGPKGHHALGQIADLGRAAELDTTQNDCDLVKLKFQTMDDVQAGKLPDFLALHLACIQRKASCS
jgi:excinuclease ABC subunit A